MMRCEVSLVSATPSLKAINHTRKHAETVKTNRTKARTSGSKTSGRT